MYCNKCGKQIAADSKFCEFCGAATGGGGNAQHARVRSPGTVSGAQNPTEITFKNLHIICGVFSLFCGIFCWGMMLFMPNWDSLSGFGIVGVILGIGCIATCKIVHANYGLAIAGTAVSLFFLLSGALF